MAALTTSAGPGGFTPGKESADWPPPREKMTEKRRDKASVKRDDSAPLGLTESTDNALNTEPPLSNPGLDDQKGEGNV